MRLSHNFRILGYVSKHRILLSQSSGTLGRYPTDWTVECWNPEMLEVLPEHKRFNNVQRHVQNNDSCSSAALHAWTFNRSLSVKLWTGCYEVSRTMWAVLEHILMGGGQQNCWGQSKTWCSGCRCQAWWCSCRSCQSVWNSNLSPCQSSGWQEGWRTRRKRSWAPLLRRNRMRRCTLDWSVWSSI